MRNKYVSVNIGFFGVDYLPYEIQSDSLCILRSEPIIIVIGAQNNGNRT